MESLTTINNISSLILILINVGAVARIIYCAIMLNNPESEQQMKKRIIHILIFLMIANSLVGISKMARYYWG